MKVKITDWTEDKYYWYKSRIGEVFEVKEDSNNSNYYCTSTGARIAKSDTIPVNEIKYELESNVRCDTCVTSCEYKKNTMVGSVGCSKCEYNCGDDKTSQTVQCSWQMDLKSIAVSFENTKQRGEIERKFMENGFEIYGLNFKKVGYKGYTKKYDCIANLSDYGLKDKTIISYEEFIRGNNMKEIINPTNIEQFAESISKVLTNSLNHITDTELHRAKVLLEKNGYTLTPPHIQPTDEEICERIKAMNEEVGYSPDKYFIYFSTCNNRWEVTTNTLDKVLGVTYTTKSIAKQIVAELNEKRLVRV